MSWRPWFGQWRLVDDRLDSWGSHEGAVARTLILVATPSGSDRIPGLYNDAELSAEPIDDMGAIAVYAFLAMTPAAAFWVFAVGYEWLARYESAVRAPVPAGRSIEHLVRDLRRLADEQRRLRHSGAPAKAARLRSLMLAYDDTLLEACLAVGLPQPGPPPLRDAVRLEIELALTQHGVVW